jgi:hypothetical protein
VLKFATAQIIAASLGDQQQRFSKAAHRAVFQYDARPGYLYVRSRAISSRTNDNHDEFPADEIAAAYRTFIGKPVFVNHVNDNHRRARGVIIDAALHQDKNPDGTPDTWAEVLMEIDAVRFPKLAKAILAGEVDRTSMGCDVERSVCSACGNEARTPAEYCAHIPALKGKRIYRRTASGKKIGELVRETCYGLSFFENSVLVEPPADPTAHFLGVDASGIGKAAAQQRVTVDLTPSASDLLNVAAAKTAEFNPADFDSDDPETDDDEDGKDTSAPKLAEPAQHPAPAAPAVPKDGAPADRQRRQDAVTKTKPYTPLKPSLNARQATASTSYEHEDKTAGKDPRFEGVGLKQDDDGWYVTTHRARSGSYDTPEKIPQSVVDKIESTGSRTTASLPVGSPFCRTCNQDLELVRNGHSAAWQHAGGTVTGHEPVPHDGRTFNQEAHRQDEAAMWTPQYPTPSTAQPPRAAALQAEAAKPQYENPGDHPWFKEAGLSHEHIVSHWNQATPEEKAQGARWYPDAHHVAKAIAKLNPDIKDDKEAAHKGAGVLSAYSPQQNWWANQHNAARSFLQKKAVGKGEGLMVMGSHASAAQRILNGEDHQTVLKGPKTADFAHLIEHAGYKPQSDEDVQAGKPPEHSDKVVIDRHALSVAAGRRLNADASRGFPSGNRHYYEHAAQHFRTAAAVISDREGRTVPPHEVQAVTWLTRQRLNAAEDEQSPGGKGRQTVQRNQRTQWRDLAGEHTPHLKDDNNSHVARLADAASINADGTISAVAYGEIKAPADVDTLREPNCPVCGDMDTFDGLACQVCGFISPPEQFRDPDLDKAKTNDLRKQIVDPALVDNNGELQRVDRDGTAMPQDGQPGDPAQDPNAPQDPSQQMIDPDQLDDNGLPPSPYGDQALDGTQTDGPAVSDRNGDGMIQPNEIDPEGNVPVQQQDMADPEQGGQVGPRELPGWGKDRTGDPFTPGPDMPYRPDEPGNPDEKLDQDDADSPYGMAPAPMQGQPGDGLPDLFCPSCGFGADATPPQTQDMGNPGGASDGIVSGDVCPSCQRAQLLTPGEINSNYSKAPAVEKPAWS